MGRRHKKSGSKTPSPAVSANASPALPPISEPAVEPPPLNISNTEAEKEVVKPYLSPIQETAPAATDISGTPGLIQRILKWIPYFRA